MDHLKELTYDQLEVLRVLYSGSLKKYKRALLGDLWDDIHRSEIPQIKFVSTRSSLIIRGLIKYASMKIVGIETGYYSPTYKGLWIYYLISQEELL